MGALTIFEADLVGRLLTPAVKPLLETAQHALARKGYGRTDAYTALSRLATADGSVPTTLSLTFQLPIGVTSNDVDAVMRSAEGITIFRLIISRKLEAPGQIPEAFEDRVRGSLVALILAQVKHQHDVLRRKGIDPRVRYENIDAAALRVYVKSLFDLLVKRGGEWAKRFSAALKNPSHGLDWAYQNIVRYQLGEIEHYLEELAAAHVPPEVELGAWLTGYRDAFMSHHSTINVPDLLERKRVPFDRLFVPGQFIPANGSSTLLVASGDTAPAAVPYDDFAELIDKTVVLGDPGGGKSTTSTLLARTAFDGSTTISFVLALKNVEMTPDGFDVVEAIERVLRVRYQCPPPPGLITKLLTEGRVFLVLDGLDELLDGATRRTAAETIDAFVVRHPSNKVVVTSRRVGYAVAKLSSGTFDEFIIGDFTDRQVREYVDKWFGVERGADGGHGATVDGFMEASRAIEDLRSNPLMLAFICVLYRGRSSIPHKRPEIFRKCVDLFLEHWDRSRGIGEVNVDLDLVELALAYIAHAMISDQRYRDGVTETDVAEIVVESLLDEGVPDRRSARQVVQELLKLCRGRAWIFTDVAFDVRGDSLFVFTHISFLEYFAALHVVRTNPDARRIAEILLPEISQGRWEVLAQICISLRTRQTTAGGAQIIDIILTRAEELVDRRRRWEALRARSLSAAEDLVRDEKHDNKDVALVEFLLRASETLPMSSSSLRKLVEISTDQFSSGRSASLASLLRSDYRYLDAVHEKLSEILGQSLTAFNRSPGSFNELVAAKAWFAVHFGYIAALPLAHGVDLTRLNRVRSKMIDTRVLNNPDRHKNLLSWNVRLQLGGRIERPDADTVRRIFEGCSPAIPHFGPRTTVHWIVDCFSAPIRRGLPAGTAAGVLRQIADALNGGGLDTSLPVGPDLHLVDPGRLMRASANLIGHDDAVQRGWSTVVMGIVEIWGITNGDGRHEALTRSGVGPLLDHVARRQPGFADRISAWRDGELNIWRSPGTETG
jgi:hypothetical protein